MVDKSNYEIALKQAQEKLATSDLFERTSKASCRMLGDDEFEVPVLDKLYRVTERGKKIVDAETGEEPTLWLQIVLLHYVLTATGEPLRRRDITFRELDGGQFYYDTYHARVIRPVLKEFGNEVERFLAAGKAIGGGPSGHNATSLRFRALPLVPITYVYWKGVEDFRADLQVLYDESISSYLSTEDVVVLSTIVSQALTGAARSHVL